MLNSTIIQNKHKTVLFLILLGMLLGVLPIFSLGLAIMFTVIGLAGLVLYFYLPKDDRKFLINLFVFSIGIRLLLLIIGYLISVFIMNWRGELSFDSRYFTIYALELSKQWRGDVIAATLDFHGTNWYTYILAFFYTLVNYGANSISPDPMLSDKLINILVGVLSVVSIFYLTKEVFGKKIAEVVSLLVAFWPSLIFWSISNLREPVNILLISILLWGIIKFGKQNKLRFVFIAFLSLICFIGIRPYLFWPLLIVSIFYFYIFNRLKIKRKLLLTGLLLLFLILIITVFNREISTFIKTDSFSIRAILNMNQNIVAQPGSSYEVYNSDVVVGDKINYIVFLKGIIKGWFYFILVPFPWAISSKPQLFFYPLMLLWYFLLFFSLIGIFWSLRYKFKLSIPIITYLIVVTFAYALVEGNIGSALRHRDLVLPFYLIFSVVGLLKVFNPKTLLNSLNS